MRHRIRTRQNWRRSTGFLSQRMKERERFRSGADLRTSCCRKCRVCNRWERSSAVVIAGEEEGQILLWQKRIWALVCYGEEEVLSIFWVAAKRWKIGKLPEKAASARSSEGGHSRTLLWLVCRFQEKENNWSVLFRSACFSLIDGGEVSFLLFFFSFSTKTGLGQRKTVFHWKIAWRDPWPHEMQKCARRVRALFYIYIYLF